MNLQQLRYICEVVRCKLNISQAAGALGTTQPAVSQQIRVLEEALGVVIFLRNRNRLTGLTPQGAVIIEIGQHILSEVANIEGIAQKRPQASSAKLRVASTHAHARYILPGVISCFHSRYPGKR